MIEDQLKYFLCKTCPIIWIGSLHGLTITFPTFFIIIISSNKKLRFIRKFLKILSTTSPLKEYTLAILSLREGLLYVLGSGFYRYKGYRGGGDQYSYGGKYYYGGEYYYGGQYSYLILADQIETMVGSKEVAEKMKLNIMAFRMKN